MVRTCSQYLWQVSDAGIPRSNRAWVMAWNGPRFLFELSEKNEHYISLPRLSLRGYDPVADGLSVYSGKIMQVLLVQFEPGSLLKLIYHAFSLVKEMNT